MTDYADVVAETTATDGTPFRVVLVQDFDTESPREWSNAGVMHVVPQSRYVVPQEGDLYGLDDAIGEHDFRVVARWLRMFHDATVVLPLYSAYGRDFNIGAGDATDTPTAGNYIGVTFDTPDTRHDVMGSDAGTDVTGAALAADVAVYAQWADGEAYFHVVQVGELNDEGDVIEWDQVDAIGEIVGGMIGREWAERAAREALDAVVADHEDIVAQRTADDAQDAAELAELRAIEVGAYAV